MPRPFQQQRFARAFQKKFGFQGYVPLTMVEDLFSTYAVDGQAIEDQFLREEWRYGAVLATAAVPAEFSAVNIISTVPPGKLAVVERILARNSDAVAYTVRLGFGQSPTTTLRYGQSMDNRIPAGNSEKFVTQGTYAALPGATTRILTRPVAAGADVELLQPGYGLVMLGDSYHVAVQTANLALEVSFLWREWRFAPQEVSG